MKFLVPIVVGAIIGYITNWLAIKMLFRPHNEKRMFGLKVPFTPGLIPKERRRIARSIGETVGTHLLTPEILVEALCSEKIDNQIKVWIENKLKSLSQSQMSVRDAADNITGGRASEIEKDIKKRISQLVISELSSSSTREKVKLMINSRIEEQAKGFTNSDSYIRLKKVLADNIKESINPKDFNELISNVIGEKLSSLKEDSRPLREIVPPSLLQSLRVYIYNNKASIAEVIKEAIQTQSVREKLLVTIAKMIEENLGRMITRFISVETIGNKVLESIERYSENPENQENIAYIIISSIDRFMSSEASDIASHITEENITRLASELSDVFDFNFILDKGEGKITDMFERGLLASGKNIIHMVRENLDSYIDEFISGNELNEIIEEFVNRSISGWVFYQPISSLINGFEIFTLDGISKIVRNSYNDFVKNKAPQIAEIIDIQGIVEDRINSFDVEFAEKIILEVASKELRAITWLGALLGGIMGVLSPLLQLLTA